MPLDRPQTKKEELYNGLTHALGLLALVSCMPILYYSALTYENGRKLWSLYPFLMGILMTYSSSAIYHFTPRGKLKDRLRIVDHISIFFLIGGTYTPMIIHYLKYPRSALFLGTMWGIILFGTVMKLWWTGKYDNLSTGLYVFLGWMVIFVIWPFTENAPAGVLWWVLAGGIAYSIGIYFYKQSNTHFYHVIWHLLVLLGTLCHLVAINLSFQLH